MHVVAISNYANSKLKRNLDLALAGLGVILLAPLMGIIALLIWVLMGRPIFFKQARPGLYGKPFQLTKFRTMTEARDDQGHLLPDKQRLTPLGCFLRKTSLDELPELWDVLRGDMSLVGPRPLLTEYLPYYTEREQLRHRILPGITGLAQTSGRNFLPWNQRLELDVQYALNCSLCFDILILVRTFIKVAAQKDVAVVPGSVSDKLTVCRNQKQ